MVTRDGVRLNAAQREFCDLLGNAWDNASDRLDGAVLRGGVRADDAFGLVGALVYDDPAGGGAGGVTFQLDSQQVEPQKTAGAARFFSARSCFLHIMDGKRQRRRRPPGPAGTRPPGGPDI